MQLVRGLHNLNKSHQGCVLTIGNFDGVHRGHQAILNRLEVCANEHNLPSTVMIFDPHPEELFNKNNAPARLSRLREKLTELKKYHVQRVVLIKFNHVFSQMTAEQFVTELLIEQLGVKHLIIGDDFRFGYKRQGDFKLLESLAVKHGFQLENTKTLELDGQRISSTAIRTFLAVGELAKAETFLNRPYTMSGKIFHGDKRGRTIGFPTANIRVNRLKNPLNGVFAVRMLLSGKDAEQRQQPGVANIGTRPTVEGTQQQLEVHLFDFDEDIYGKYVVVEFLHHIRGEKRFSGLDELKQQISTDVKKAKQLLNITTNQ